jgi:hypothetical protein
MRARGTRNLGGPGVIRTPDLRFRKPLLYPAELRGPDFLTHSVYNDGLTRAFRFRMVCFNQQRACPVSPAFLANDEQHFIRLVSESARLRRSGHGRRFGHRRCSRRAIRTARCRAPSWTLRLNAHQNWPQTSRRALSLCASICPLRLGMRQRLKTIQLEWEAVDQSRLTVGESTERS